MLVYPTDEVWNLKQVIFHWGIMLDLNAAGDQLKINGSTNHDLPGWYSNKSWLVETRVASLETGFYLIIFSWETEIIEFMEHVLGFLEMP